MEKWLRSGFSQLFTRAPDRSPKEKRRILSEWTQALRKYGHLWYAAEVAVVTFANSDFAPIPNLESGSRIFEILRIWLLFRLRRRLPLIQPKFTHVFTKRWNRTAACAAVDWFILNCWGKHKRKMAIQGIRLTGKQPPAMELPQRVHSTDTRLHNYYIGRSELR